MNALEKIQESAQSIITICEKQRLSKSDKDKLLRLQGAIFSQIDSLMECEVCGRISDLIASITIENTTANLCRQCGIEALTNGQIKKNNRRTSRKSSINKKPIRSQNKKERQVNASMGHQISSIKTNPADLMATIEAESGLKKPTIRRIEKMIAEIATPMNVEHTFQYVINEAKIAKMKVSDEQLEKVVKILMKNVDKA